MADDDAGQSQPMMLWPFPAGDTSATQQPILIPFVNQPQIVNMSSASNMTTFPNVYQQLLPGTTGLVAVQQDSPPPHISRPGVISPQVETRELADSPKPVHVSVVSPVTKESGHSWAELPSSSSPKQSSSSSSERRGSVIMAVGSTPPSKKHSGHKKHGRPSKSGDRLSRREEVTSSSSGHRRHRQEVSSSDIIYQQQSQEVSSSGIQQNQLGLVYVDLQQEGQKGASPSSEVMFGHFKREAPSPVHHVHLAQAAAVSGICPPGMVLVEAAEMTGSGSGLLPTSSAMVWGPPESSGEGEVPPIGGGMLMSVDPQSKLISKTPPIHSRFASFEPKLDLRKRRGKKPADIDAFTVPLRKGWRRETMIRSHTKADVCYTTPCGRRLRAYQEVTRYLELNHITDLTVDNFSFSTKIMVGQFLEAREDGSSWRVLTDDEIASKSLTVDKRLLGCKKRKVSAETPTHHRSFPLGPRLPTIPSGGGREAAAEGGVAVSSSDGGLVSGDISSTDDSDANMVIHLPSPGGAQIPDRSNPYIISAPSEDNPAPMEHIPEEQQNNEYMPSTALSSPPDHSSCSSPTQTNDLESFARTLGPRTAIVTIAPADDVAEPVSNGNTTMFAREMPQSSSEEQQKSSESVAMTTGMSSPPELGNSPPDPRGMVVYPRKRGRKRKDEGGSNLPIHLPRKRGNSVSRVDSDFPKRRGRPPKMINETMQAMTSHFETTKTSGRKVYSSRESSGGGTPGGHSHLQVMVGRAPQPHPHQRDHYNGRHFPTRGSSSSQDGGGVFRVKRKMGRPRKEEAESRRRQELRLRAEKARRKAEKLAQRKHMKEERLEVVQQRRVMESHQAKQKQQDILQHRKSQVAFFQEEELRRKQRELSTNLVDRNKQFVVEDKMRREQQIKEFEIQYQLKKPIEDLELEQMSDLPNFRPISTGGLSATAFAHMQVVFEFIVAFQEFLALEEMPSFPALCVSLHNVDRELFFRVFVHLLKPLLADFGAQTTVATGANLLDIELTAFTASEMFRILVAMTMEDVPVKLKPIIAKLESESVSGLRPSDKAAILNYMVDSLLISNSLVQEIDSRMEAMSNLRREKWKVNLKLKKFRTCFNTVHTTAEEVAILMKPPPYKGRGRPPRKPQLAMDDDSSDDDEPQDTEGEDPVVTEDLGEVSPEESDEDIPRVKDRLEVRIKKLKRKQATIRSLLNRMSLKLRSFPLGNDRYTRAYWQLPTLGGVYVEGVDCFPATMKLWGPSCPDPLHGNESDHSPPSEEEGEEKTEGVRIDLAKDVVAVDSAVATTTPKPSDDSEANTVTFDRDCPVAKETSQSAVDSGSHIEASGTVAMDTVEGLQHPSSGDGTVDVNLQSTSNSLGHAHSVSLVDSSSGVTLVENPPSTTQPPGRSNKLKKITGNIVSCPTGPLSPSNTPVTMTIHSPTGVGTVTGRMEVTPVATASTIRSSVITSASYEGVGSKSDGRHDGTAGRDVNELEEEVQGRVDRGSAPPSRLGRESREARRTGSAERVGSGPDGTATGVTGVALPAPQRGSSPAQPSVWFSILPRETCGEPCDMDKLIARCTNNAAKEEEEEEEEPKVVAMETENLPQPAQPAVTTPVPSEPEPPSPKDPSGLPVGGQYSYMYVQTAEGETQLCLVENSVMPYLQSVTLQVEVPPVTSMDNEVEAEPHTAQVSVEVGRWQFLHQNFQDMLESLDSKQFRSPSELLSRVEDDKKNGWWFLEKGSDIELFIKKLTSRGYRERNLFKTLSKVKGTVTGPTKEENSADKLRDFSQVVSNHYASEGQSEVPMETNQDSHSQQLLRRVFDSTFPEENQVQVSLLSQELRGIEERLFAANLERKGSEPQCSKMETSLTGLAGGSADRLAAVARGLLAVLAEVDQQYLNLPLSGTAAPPSTPPPLDASHGASDDADVKPSLLDMWKSAVTEATSASQLAVCMVQLDKSIAWEKSLLKVFCTSCHKADDEANLLLCDGCDRGTHTYCCRPKLSTVPAGDWFCSNCVSTSAISRECTVCLARRGPFTHCLSCPRVYHKKCLASAVPTKLKGDHSRCPNCVKSSSPNMAVRSRGKGRSGSPALSNQSSSKGRDHSDSPRTRAREADHHSDSPRSRRRDHADSPRSKGH